LIFLRLLPALSGYAAPLSRSAISMASFQIESALQRNSGMAATAAKTVKDLASPQIDTDGETISTSPPANPMPDTAPYGSIYWDQWIRYFVTRDPGFNSLSLDPPTVQLSELAGL
jgi:hypothetical protein